MSHPATWANRTMVCIPTGELAYTAFWRRLLTLKHLGWHIDNDLLMVYDTPAYVQDSHNKLVEAALKVPGWTRLLWLEHDHFFPVDLLQHMASYEEPIVGGMYFSRSVENPSPVVYEWADEERTKLAPYQPWQIGDMLREPGLHKVDVVPMGCTSIRRDVLEGWPEEIPWYSVATAQRKTGGIMGDDVWFCRHSQDQGYDIFVDSRLQIDHLTLVPYNLSVYNAWVGKMKREGKTGEHKPALEVVRR